MSEEEDNALSLLLEEMKFCLHFYDTDSEIYAKISAALKVWGVKANDTK